MLQIEVKALGHLRAFDQIQLCSQDLADLRVHGIEVRRVKIIANYLGVGRIGSLQNLPLNVVSNEDLVHHVEERAIELFNLALVVTLQALKFSSPIFGCARQIRLQAFEVPGMSCLICLHEAVGPYFPEPAPECEHDGGTSAERGNNSRGYRQ